MINDSSVKNEAAKKRSEHIKYQLISDPDKVMNYHISRVLLRVVAEIASKKANFKVLDVGCGRGELLAKLQKQGYQTFGIDIDTKCVELSSHYGEVYQVSIEEFVRRNPPNSFDVVIASHLLEHLPAPQEALKNLMYLGKYGVLVAIPNPYYLLHIFRALFRMNPYQATAGHWYAWDYSHFKTFVERCGFSVRKWYYDSVSLPVYGAVRRSLGYRILNVIEGYVLRCLFPQFCWSIIAHVIDPKMELIEEH